MGRWGAGALGAAALVIFASASASADPETPRGTSVRVEFQGPEGCGGAGAFIERMTARTRSVAVVREEDASWKLSVSVTRSARGPESHGELTLRAADGTESKRSVDGDSCENVVDALALMSAMALDPAVLSGAAPRDVPAPVPAPRPLPATDASVPSSDAVDGWRWSIWGGGGVELGMSPNPEPEVTAGVDLALADRGPWTPDLRVGFAYAIDGDAAVSGGGVRAARTAAVAQSCPLSWSAGPLRASPCLHLEGGVLSATGLGVQPGFGSTRPWFAVGAIGTVRFTPVAWSYVELFGGAKLPLVRDRFYFEPSGSTVFEASPVGGTLGATLGFRVM